MGYPYHDMRSHAALGAVPSASPEYVSRLCAPFIGPHSVILSKRSESKDLAARTQAFGTRLFAVAMVMVLVLSMLPVVGIQFAFADEPVAPAERPETTGGDVALEGSAAMPTSNESAEAASFQAPVATTRDDGMHVADGLVYTVADGGLALACFDGEPPEGALSVPASVSVDGRDTPVVAVDITEGQVADRVVVLSLPQGIKDVKTDSVAAAFPNLLSVEVVAVAGSSLPVAAGAVSMRAAYSSSGGMLFRPTIVEVANEDGSTESVECKELVWAPPALVQARIPIECRAIAEGAFRDVRDLRTIVTFGTMERIADGAFAKAQVANAKVVVPASSPVVVEEGAGRVSASMALMGDAGQKERRAAWRNADFPDANLVMGKPCGSLTETAAVGEDGIIERVDLRLIYYPDMHPKATDVKHPDENGRIDMADNGLAFTVKSDMTVSVEWKGDRSATPARVEIPSSISIDAVTYPVAEIGEGAFAGAAFLESVIIPETIIAIGDAAFANCTNLAAVHALAALGVVAASVFDEAVQSGDARTPFDAAMDAIAEETTAAPGDALEGAANPGAFIAREEVTASDGTGAYATGSSDGSADSGNRDVLPANEELSSLSDGSITTYSDSLINGHTYVWVKTTPEISGLSWSNAGIWGLAIPDSYGFDETITFSRTVSEIYTRLLAQISSSGRYVYISLLTDVHTIVGQVCLKAPEGWRCITADAYYDTSHPVVMLSCVRDEAIGTNELALASHYHDSRYYTESEIDAKKIGSRPSSGLPTTGYGDLWASVKSLADAQLTLGTTSTTAAPGNHNHDGVYAKKSVYAGATSDSSQSFYAITYQEEDGSTVTDPSKVWGATFPSYHMRGQAPSIPIPQKAGYTFKEWKYRNSSDPAGRWYSYNKSSWAYSSPVILKAFWTEGEPYDASYAKLSHTHAAGDITSGTFGTSRLDDSAITEAKLAADAVTSSKIKNGEVKTDDLADKNVTTGKLADDAVTTVKIKNLNVTTDKLAAKAVTAAKLADATITAAQLADDAVTEAKLASDAVTSAKIKNGEVKTDDLAASAVTDGKLATDSVLTAKIKNLNVTTAKLADKAVANAKLGDDAVTSGKIKDGEVKTGDLADKSVTTDKLANGAVTTDQLGAGAVTTAKIADKNVTTDKLADAAVTSGKIAAGAVADDKLASTFVKPTEFGSICYEGLDETDANTYPTVYRQGGMPAVHQPVREGYEFMGWEWRRGGESGTSADLDVAFAKAGDMTMTATWREVVPEANYFFTNNVPLRADSNSATQSHVLKVRLSDFERNIGRVAFDRDDGTGILKKQPDGTPAPIELWVGNREDVIGSGVKVDLGDSATASLDGIPLAQLGDESWGLYVGIRVRTADMDASRLVSSYADGSYVVSLVKMSYEFSY